MPINLHKKTIERTKVINGKRINVMPEEYHSDNLKGTNKVFCYRNYGYDISNKLKHAGFKSCKIIEPVKSILFGFGRPIIIATK